jgi:hypothetical protein
MPDVYQKVKPASNVDNGSSCVFYNNLTQPTGISPDVNLHQIVSQSGILDSRFDDVDYYTA